MKRIVTQSSWVLCLCGMLLLGACKKEEAAPSELTPDQKAQLLAKLVAADAADGTEDKVIGKCTTCALRMDGDAKHAMTYEGYTMHFCSEKCRDLCKKNPVDIVMKN